MAPRAEALEGVVDRPLHDLLLVPQRGRGRDHVLLRGGMDLAQRRDDVQAQPVSRQSAVLVGLVLPPGQARGLTIGAGVRA